MPKITDYPVTTTLADTDLMDWSTDIGGTPVTESINFFNLKLQLGLNGTAFRVPRYKSTGSGLEAGQITDNGTQVGINKSTGLIARLHILGGPSQLPLVIDADVNSYALAINGAGNVSINGAGAFPAKFHVKSSGSDVFATVVTLIENGAGTDLIDVRANGNIGFGTAADASFKYKFSGGSDLAFFQNPTAGGTNYAALFLRHGTIQGLLLTIDAASTGYGGFTRDTVALHASGTVGTDLSLAAASAGLITFGAISGTFQEKARMDASTGNLALKTTTLTDILNLGTSTEAFAIVDAGSTGATEQDWVQVKVGGVTGYIRVFATT